MSRQTEFRSAGSNLGSTIKQSLRMMAGQDVPNYTLVFLDPTTQHSRGESKNMVVPYVVFGRGSSCNVQYGDEYSTVSRQHCSIQADQSGCSLIHNPQATNPTLVDGKPIIGHHRLKSGDEIQLSYEGPRIRFLADQTQRTSTMGFTRRMSVALAQSLRPYRRALAVIGFLLVAAIAYSAWSTMQIQDLNKQQAALAEEIATSDDKIQIQEAELAALRTNEQANASKIAAGMRALNAERQRRANLQAQIREVQEEMEEAKTKRDEESVTESDVAATKSTPASSEERTVPTTDETGLAGEDLTVLEPFIYYIKVEKFEITDKKTRKKIQKGMDKQLDSLFAGVYGTGFLASGGHFITARHVIQPWLYIVKNDKCGPWARLNNYIHNTDYDIIINYRAYSPIAGDEFRFTNTQNFSNDDSKQDIIKDLRQQCSRVPKNFAIRTAEFDDTDWIYFRVDNKSSKLLFNRDLSTDLYKSEVVHILSFPQGVTQKPEYNKGQSALAQETGLLTISGGMRLSYGSTGAPVFISRNGEYIVIGLLSHEENARVRAVPVQNLQ